MITRRGFADGVLLGAAVLALSGCDALERPATEARYRMVLAVETPEGVKNGSSVIELRAVSNPDWMRKSSGRTGATSFKGEAVAVDLPNGQTLFALLRGEADGTTPYTLLRYAQKIDMATVDNPQELLERMAGNREEFVLPRRRDAGCVPSQRCNDSAYPMLVTFKDIADPTSVVRVDPDDLAPSFGAGYRLKAITVQVTDEPVTVGIDRKLPSYGPETGFDEWFKGLPYGDPKAISKSDFIRN